jgi:CrcB protein
MDMLWVGLGGAAGSLARYAIGRVISGKTNGAFPWGTLAVNISGALLLGVVTGLDMPHNTALLLADGFLGAYTTFSTVMYEGFHLFRSRRANAAVYIAGSFVLGLAFFAVGHALTVKAR